MERRKFLRLTTAATVGTVVGATTPTIGKAIDLFVERNTPYFSGNAGTRESLVERCSPEPNPQYCMDNIPYPLPESAFKNAWVAFYEEAQIRAVPSFLLDLFNKMPNLRERVIYGDSTTLGLNRREVLMGIASTTCFSFAHNLTPTKLDTQTIHSSALFIGGILWYLQRKLGFISNTTAHFTYNTIVRVFQFQREYRKV